MEYVALVVVEDADTGEWTGCAIRGHANKQDAVALSDKAAQREDVKSFGGIRLLTLEEFEGGFGPIS